MKLLVAALLCLPAAFSRPAEVAQTEAPEVETKVEEAEVEEAEVVEAEVVEGEVEAQTTESPPDDVDDERFPRSYTYYMLVPAFQARGVSEPLVPLSSDTQIPRGTLSIFTPPVFRTKAQREMAYFGDTQQVAPPHSHLVVQNELFFDTFDHAKVILGYEKRRKMARVPPHLLKSLRPFFPFFVLD